jgi:actin-related protein
MSGSPCQKLFFDQMILACHFHINYFSQSFNMSIAGLDQSGLAATVALSISLLPQDLQGMFWANIGMIGGNTKFPGFRERL